MEANSFRLCSELERSSSGLCFLLQQYFTVVFLSYENKPPQYSNNSVPSDDVLVHWVHVKTKRSHNHSRGTTKKKKRKCDALSKKVVWGKMFVLKYKHWSTIRYLNSAKKFRPNI